jgi:hypothetical protein
LAYAADVADRADVSDTASMVEGHLMRTLLSFFALGALSIVLAGCAATVGAGGLVNVPSDSRAQCATHCQSIGLELSAVVVMANNVGCVCNAGPANDTPKAAAASASAGGMAAMMAAQEERDRQSRLQTSRH